MNQQPSNACKNGILNDVAIRALCTEPTFDQLYLKAKTSYLNKIGVYDVRDTALSESSENIVLDEVRRLSESWKPMIAPFEPKQVRYVDARAFEQSKIRDHLAVVQEAQHRVISYGTTSYGYDVTLAEEGFKIFSGLNVTEIDPMDFDDKCLIDAQVKINPKNGLRYILLPPHSYGLGVTREYFHMPRDVVALCIGKSTYARAGVLINATPIEPGFVGNVVIEVGNLTPIPARVYLNTGIAQFLFFRGEEECETSYADRDGKYMRQTGVQLPLI